MLNFVLVCTFLLRGHYIQFFYLGESKAVVKALHSEPEYSKFKVHCALVHIISLPVNFGLNLQCNGGLTEGERGCLVASDPRLASGQPKR